MQYSNMLFIIIKNFSEPFQLQTNEKLIGITIEKRKIMRPVGALIIKEVEVKLQRNLVFAKHYLFIRGKCLQFLWELRYFYQKQFF